MTPKPKATFGSTVRRERERQKVGLRQFAKQIGVSPTYLSKVERDELPAPAEDKVVRIAELLGRDRDELLALGNKVSSDLTEIIKRRPRELASFLRSVNGLSPSDMARITKQAKKVKK